MVVVDVGAPSEIAVGLGLNEKPVVGATDPNMGAGVDPNEMPDVVVVGVENENVEVEVCPTKRVPCNDETQQ